MYNRQAKEDDSKYTKKSSPTLSILDKSESIDEKNEFKQVEIDKKHK